jgi:cell division septation protein DedD
MASSVRNVLLGFLALVALCAVFFSLGFLVGHNERHGSSQPTAEQIPPPAENAPPASAPPEVEQIGPEGSASASAVQGAKEPSGARTGGEQGSENGGPTPNTRQASKPDADAGVTLQVAALRTQPSAESLVKELQSRGYRAFILPPQPGTPNGELFRVCVGPFAARAEAEAARQKLSQEGFPAFIRHSPVTR